MTTAPATGTDIPSIPQPGTALDWAAAILLGLGIDPGTHKNALYDLAAQINLEHGSNTVTGNNPLYTSLRIGNSTTINSAGVQSYTDWGSGLSAQIDMLQQSNMAPILAALKANASISQYATALASGSWEGNNPKAAAANAAYGMSVAARYNSMLKGGGFDSLTQTMTDYINKYGGGISAGNIPPGSTGPGPGLGQLPQAAAGIAGTLAGGPGWLAELSAILGDLVSADWWKRVGLFAAGLVLVIGGTILFISTTKTGERVESDAMLAAAA